MSFKSIAFIETKLRKRCLVSLFISGCNKWMAVYEVAWNATLNALIVGRWLRANSLTSQRRFFLWSVLVLVSQHLDECENKTPKQAKVEALDQLLSKLNHLVSTCFMICLYEMSTNSQNSLNSLFDT